MLHNEDSVLLSEYRFNVCEALNATIQGNGVFMFIALCPVCLPPNRFDIGL